MLKNIFIINVITYSYYRARKEMLLSGQAVYYAFTTLKT